MFSVTKAVVEVVKATKATAPEKAGKRGCNCMLYPIQRSASTSAERVVPQSRQS